MEHADNRYALTSNAMAVRQVCAHDGLGEPADLPIFPPDCLASHASQQERPGCPDGGPYNYAGRGVAPSIYAYG